MNKARSAFIVVCAFFALAATAAPASAATITVDQNCIDPGSLETGGGLVSGSFSGAPYGGSQPGSPTGSRYDPLGFVMAGRNPSDDQLHFGGQSVTVNPDGSGTFSFNLGAF